MSSSVSTDYSDIWETLTATNSDFLPYRLIMQDDGNLVIYDRNNIPKWASHTMHFGLPPRRLFLNNDGILVKIDATDRIVWQNKY